MLDLEGDDTPDPKLNEFRSSNIELLKKKEELERQLAEERARVAQAAPKEEENKTLSQKVDHLTKQWEQERTARTMAEKSAKQEAFRSAFMGGVAKHKVRDDAAATALYTLASLTYKEKDGAFVPQDAQGNTLYSKQEAAKPLPLEEWIEQAKTGTYKDLFLQPQGGGGRGSNGATGSAGPRIVMTKAEAQKPNAAQFAAMQKGLVDIQD